jgi:hypothetical protein
MYLWALEQYPIPVKSATAAVLSAIADIAAQKLRGENNFRLNSVIFQAIVAGGYRAPILHFWIAGVEKLCGKYAPVWIKVALDQIVFAPALIFGYLAIVARFNGKSWKEFKEDLKKTFRKIMINNYKVWPIVSLFNFKFVPVHLRVLVSNIVGFFWTIYLILSTQEKKEKKV